MLFRLYLKVVFCIFVYRFIYNHVFFEYMEGVYVLRYGELALKGRNRIDFEKRLIANIEDFLMKNNFRFEKIIRPRGRIVVYSDDEIDFSKVFGLT